MVRRTGRQGWYGAGEGSGRECLGGSAVFGLVEDSPVDRRDRAAQRASVTIHDKRSYSAKGLYHRRVSRSGLNTPSGGRTRVQKYSTRLTTAPRRSSSARRSSRETPSGGGEELAAWCGRRDRRQQQAGVRMRKTERAVPNEGRYRAPGRGRNTHKQAPGWVGARWVGGSAAGKCTDAPIRCSCAPTSLTTFWNISSDSNASWLLS